MDHIAVAPSGVWVIDAKTHRGALEVRRSGGQFSPRVEKLFIGGRDRSGLVEGLAKQVAAVSDELARVGAPMIVRGALCFVGTELPWFGSSHLAEVPLVGRRGLGKLLAAPGDLTAQDPRGDRAVPARAVPARRALRADGRYGQQGDRGGPIVAPSGALRRCVHRSSAPAERSCMAPGDVRHLVAYLDWLERRAEGQLVDLAALSLDWPVRRE